MRREILRINNLNYEYTLTRKLKNISFYILEGECIGFFGLTYSGKDLLVQLLDGDIEETPEHFFVYIDGQKVSGQAALRKKVYHMTESNFMIDDWTVAEYLGLVAAGQRQIILHAKLLEEEIRDYFNELSLDVDVGKMLKDLSESEKRIVDLAKAIRQGAKVTVIEDEFEGMTQDAIEAFAAAMKQLIAGRMAVIVSSHSNMVLSVLSDKYILFSGGQIVKKCKKNYIRDAAHLERFLIGDSGMSGKIASGGHTPGQTAGKDTVYRVRGIRLRSGWLEDFSFVRGEAVTLLVLNRREKERIFMLLSGRRDEEGIRYAVRSGQYDNVSPGLFAREKIVSVKHLGSQEEIFAEMTVGENLILPSLQKLSFLEYVVSSGRLSKMLEQGMEMDGAEQGRCAKSLDVNELIEMTLERWYIYNPLVLVLFEPFVQCDVYGVSIVKSYIKKFTDRGTSVIMIKSREEYVEDISDRIMSID